MSRRYFFPAIILGALGGMAWAAIAAVLKVRFNANEILVTLMLSSVALQILYYLLLGPEDPMGFNFPQTTMFQDAALFPPIIFGFRLNYSLIIPLLFTVFVWIYMERHFGGFQLVVGGLAPSAATYAGYSSSGAVWKSLLIAGFAAGIAGMSEVAGPIGQLQRSVTSGYGYSAIIVAYLGITSMGIFFAAFFLSVIHIGGDYALVTAATDQFGAYLSGASTGDISCKLYLCKLSFQASQSVAGTHRKFCDMTPLEFFYGLFLLQSPFFLRRWENWLLKIRNAQFGRRV